MTLGVFSKDIYAAIVHYLLECEHISIPIRESFEMLVIVNLVNGLAVSGVN